MPVFKYCDFQFVVKILIALIVSKNYKTLPSDMFVLLNGASISRLTIQNVSLKFVSVLSFTRWSWRIKSCMNTLPRT